MTARKQARSSSDLRRPSGSDGQDVVGRVTDRGASGSVDVGCRMALAHENAIPFEA